jgi:hypothetical protein
MPERRSNKVLSPVGVDGEGGNPKSRHQERPVMRLRDAKPDAEPDAKVVLRLVRKLIRKLDAKVVVSEKVVVGSAADRLLASSVERAHAMRPYASKSGAHVEITYSEKHQLRM